MMSVYLILFVFVGILALGGFFWFWWAAPQWQVPSHLKSDEIKQRELQDRLRQTSYQVLTGVGLIVTFVATLVQFSITSRQWSSDYDLRLRHEQAQQFAEAAKDLVGADRAAFAEQAAQRLSSFAIKNPADFNRQAHGILASVVREGTKGNDLHDSQECRVNSSDPDGSISIKEPENYDREEAPPAAQAAIIHLGSAKFATLRHSYTSGACVDPQDDGAVILNFGHHRFDNFDLSGLDLSCARMDQARLRRASLISARLFGADLRGARLADWDILNSPAATGWLDGQRFTTADIGFDQPTNGGNRGKKPARLESWRTYRCFITDLRNSDLRGADLEGAALGGADLTGADLTGGNLCGANISRANFTGAKGLTTGMMKKTCVGWSSDTESALAAMQPIGLERIFTNDFKRIEACPKNCEPMDRAAAYALINRPRRWPRWPTE
jgi:uncharacterized protein YjbI with pentapeptide repeats